MQCGGNKARCSELESLKEQQLLAINCVRLQSLGAQAKAAHLGLSWLQEDGFNLLYNIYFTRLDSLQPLYAMDV